MIEPPQIVQAPAETTATIQLKVPRDQIRAVMGPAYQELMATVAAQGLTPTGPWYSHHFRMDPALFDFEIGVPVPAPVQPAGRVKPGRLPSGKVARTIYHGDYEGLPAAWGEFERWIRNAGLNVVRTSGSAMWWDRNRTPIPRRSAPSSTGPWSASSLTTKGDADLRKQLVKVLGWHDAHADFDAAVADLPPAQQGLVPKGLPYSPWQLVEHIRLTQADILEFCRNPQYQEMSWPEDYWPKVPAPSEPGAWDKSIAAYRRDRDDLARMIEDPRTDLFAKVPAGKGQTFLREFLLVADHTSYHVGQLVAVRRLLGHWEA